MADSIATGVLAAYYAILLPLALYGLHRLRLLWLLDRPSRGHTATAHARERPARSARVSPSPRASLLPTVTVQLPIYNELLVAPRLVEAVAALDYPAELLEIQILDDSDDETSQVLAEQTQRLVSAGGDVHHLRRAERSGFKAGALEAGMRQAKGELIAIFDADFVPQPDFLLRTVGHFDDPKVGMVQAAWGHLNRRYSLLTRIQALLLDGHFQVEHAARARGGLFFNFNGTAGIWRRQTIEDAGGWQHDTLTEDLDLSYRAQLRGWRFVFCPDLLVPSELPIEIAAFKSQQHRWTHGAAQTLRKLLPRILRAPLPLRVKLEAVAHLSAHLCYPLMVVFTLLLLPSMSVRLLLGPSRFLWLDLPLFAAATLSIVAFFLRSQRQHGESVGRTLALQLPLMALGIGMSLHNARAALTGLVRRGGTFERTPKHRIEPKQRAESIGKRQPGGAPSSASAGAGARTRYAAVTSGRIGELLMVGYLLISIGVASVEQMWWSLPFLLLFVSGYGYVLWLSRASVAHLAFDPRLEDASSSESLESAKNATDAAPSTISRIAS